MDTIRKITAKVETPICGARLDDLHCESYSPIRCNWICVKDRDKDAEELDLFERVEFTDEELEEMYANDNHRKELTTNMDEEEWQ